MGNVVADATGASTSTGTAVIRWPATGGTNQQWQLVSVPEPNATYTLVNRTSGMLADVSGASSSAGGQLIQWQANSGANQQWYLTLAY